MNNSFYLVEQYAKEIQARRLSEAKNYNNWSRVRKALRHLEECGKVR